MKALLRMTCVIGFTVVVTAVLPRTGQAFRNVKTGDTFPNVELENLKGRRIPVQSPDAKVNLVLFFRPTQAYSMTAISVLADLCKSYSKKSVHCTVVVSDYYSTKTVRRAINSVGWKPQNIVVDKEDWYNNRIGVIHYPVFGITDSSFTLEAEESSFNPDCAARIEARIRFALGEIDKHQLILALNPPAEDVNRKRDKAEIHYQYAKRLIETGKLDEALKRAFEATKIDNTYADAFALLGLIYTKQKKCDKAIPELERAFELEPDNAEAKRVRALCK